MKRAAFLFILLAGVAHGDNAFHVDLSLKTAQTNAAPQHVRAPIPVAAPVFNQRQGGVIRVIRAQNGNQVIFNGINFAGQVGTAETVDTPLQGPELRWKNGESLPGELVACSADDLTWKSPLFDDPLQVKWDVIDRIDWPTVSETPKDPFGIALRDGSFIYGDLVSIDADTITIHSTRHGNTVLKRSEVLSLRRREHDKLLYGGPTGDIGWQAMTNQQDGNVVRNADTPETASSVVTAPGGALLIRSWNRSAFLNVTLPLSVDVEFRVHSSKRPEFAVALGGSLHEPLRVETWDNVLVLADGDQFKIIRRVQDDERQVALRICWDANSRDCSVFDASGALITSWKVPGTASPSTPGFIVQNRGLDLSLDLLRVRAWDGKTPAKVDPKQPYVELDDGRSVAGPIITGPAGSVSVQSAGQPVSFPLKDVDAIVFSSDSPQTPGHEASLAFNDGTMLFGHVASVTGDHASFITAFTSAPLSVQMDSPRQLLSSFTDPLATTPPATPAPTPATPLAQSPLDDLDKIVIQDTTLHGKLASTADGALGWLPVGGVKPAHTSAALSSEITRAVPKTAPLSTDPALFYLASGDILPGTLRSLDRTGVQFESSLMDSRELPAAQLEAIEFSPSTRLEVQGFSDPAWQIVKGDDKGVRRADNTLQMDAGTSISLGSLMQCGEFSFKYNSNGFSAMRARLFCAGKDDANSMNVLLCSSGNQFTTGLESAPGQFDNQFQIRTQPGVPITVRFKVEDNVVNLFVNEIPAGQFPIDPAKCPGSGVILEPASIWGNQVFTVSLSDFAAHSALGRSWLPEVTSDVKNQVLTVPRFEKDDPPRHLLLAANGDVLRGEIEAATDSHFGFRCGLENLNVPRERVRAVIWLQPPPKEVPAAAAPAPAPAPEVPSSSDPLNDRLPTSVTFPQIDLSSILNYMRAQDKGLKIQAPDEVIGRRIENIQLGNQTVSDALIQLCARFDLHYRVDPDNTIVLEVPANQGVGELVTKSYWIKPDALPATGSTQDLLGMKGISWPRSTSVEWRPGSGVLTMVNTEANQAKLAALIGSDYGGILGSPTHWVELTSGGRLALAVDKFGPDFIEAHHPVYGAIKVPMAQVYVIRTTAPEPTSTSRALQDWRLVNAAEPVIPTGNSENSPLLGKDAPNFTLPTLDNGDFDLSAQKGHIIVLDFWASWCGPCIKALPGLISTISAFPPDKVTLVGINQGESPDQAKRFLDLRALKLNTTLDVDQAVAQKYGVDAIPRTIIIGPDGKVAWDQAGYDPDGEGTITEVIKKLLDPSAPATPPAPQ